METAVLNYEKLLPIFRHRGGEAFVRKMGKLTSSSTFFENKRECLAEADRNRNKYGRSQLQSKVKAFNTGGAPCKLHPDTEPHLAQPSLLLIITANLRTRAVR